MDSMLLSPIMRMDAKSLIMIKQVHCIHKNALEGHEMVPKYVTVQVKVTGHKTVFDSASQNHCDSLSICGPVKINMT